MSVPGSEGEDKVVSDINTTPLVDVMLVLLIIFLITVPVITKSVKVELPNASNIPTQTTPKDVVLSVDAGGNYYLGGEAVPDREALLRRIAQEAVKVPQPELHIRADRGARFEHVGRALFIVQQGGLVKVGFLTEPRK
jgi:biopolymer transport protein ExbD